MTRRIECWCLTALLLAAGPAAAQTYYGQRPDGQAQGARAGQPHRVASPPYPTIHRRPDPQRPSAPPFVLTPAEQARLDQVLKAWEEHSAKVKTFESKFTRLEYDGVFSDDPSRPRFVDEGDVKYAAPDKGMFQVVGQRPEHWICDGKSMFEYDFQKRQLVEYKLPPEMQGKAITDGPLPFMFGGTAEKLKRRYFLRIVTPENVRGQVWLEARPRFQEDADNFQRAEVILDADSMNPVAIQTHQPNGNRTVYKFDEPKINVKDPLRHLDPLNLFEKDPFRPHLPHGWTKIVEQPPAAQASRQQADGSMR